MQKMCLSSKVMTKMELLNAVITGLVLDVASWVNEANTTYYVAVLRFGVGLLFYFPERSRCK